MKKIKTVSTGILVALSIFFVSSVILFTGCAKQEEDMASGVNGNIGGFDGTQAQLSGDLTISTFYDNNYLELAAERFMAANEGVTITINNMAGDERRVDNYSQAIITAIMGGKGDDLIDVSVLPLFRFAEQDLLVDLDEYIGDQLNNDEYYTGVMDAFKYNGKRYTIPFSFNFEACKPNSEMLETLGTSVNFNQVTLEDLLALSSEMPEDGSAYVMDHGGWGVMSDSELAYIMYQLNEKVFLDIENKEVKFDNGEFVQMLETIDLLTGKGHIVSAGLSYEDIDYSLPAMINMYNVYGPMMAHSGTEPMRDMVLLANSEGKGVVYNNGNLLAVNNNSQNKELAAQFMLYLVSEEMQSDPELLFAPVNKNAARVQAKALYNSALANGYLPEGFTEEDMENNMNHFNQLVENLSIREYTSMQVRDFVLEEIRSYYTGEVSAQQAAQNLQSTINTFLKE